MDDTDLPARFVPTHLDALCKIIETAPSAEGTWRSSKPLAWYKQVREGGARYVLQHDEVARADIIHSVVASDGHDIEGLCATIFAWGGMRRDHGRKLFSDAGLHQWLPTAQQVLTEPLTRAESYDRFRRLRLTSMMKGAESYDRFGRRLTSLMKGAGPAYFTKLIFFLMHKRRDAMPVGYIMDQWTARSINLLLLTNREPIHLQGNATVTDRNDAQSYERFCRNIEQLTDNINQRTGQNLKPDEVERQLMSHGGKRHKKGAWRQYLLDNEPSA